MITLEVEVMLTKENAKASVSLIYLDLKPPYTTEVAELVAYVIGKFQKFDCRRERKREHVVRFLDSMEAYARDAHLCMMEFSKSLMDLLIPSMSTQNQVDAWVEHFVSLFDTNFFWAERTLPWLNSKNVLLSNGDLVVYIKGFHQKALDVVIH